MATASLLPAELEPPPSHAELRNLHTTAIAISTIIIIIITTIMEDVLTVSEK